MPFDELLAGRIRDVLTKINGVSEKRMFGGLGFLLDGKLLVAVWHQSLLARVGKIQAERALALKQARLMDITGKPLSGWLILEPPQIESDAQLADWVDQSIEFVRTLPPPPLKSTRNRKKPKR